MCNQNCILINIKNILIKCTSIDNPKKVVHSVEQNIAGKYKQTETISRQCNYIIWLNLLYKYFLQ